MENVLDNVCPNCGGGFSPRPIRPKQNLKNENYLGRYPASSTVVYAPVDPDEHEKFATSIRNVEPRDR